MICFPPNSVNYAFNLANSACLVYTVTPAGTGPMEHAHWQMEEL